MRSLFILSIYAALISLAFAANILLTTTDSWADKNPRYLYRAMIEAGHNVVFVGPLSATGSGSVENMMQDTTITSQKDLKLETFSHFAKENTGDFGHLRMANQKYFFHIQKLNARLRKGRKYPSGKVPSKNDSEFEKLSETVVKNDAYGQDVLNPNFWYVNGTPLESLSVAFEVIIPQHLPTFVPDLVIIGPNEGLHLAYQTSPQVSGITAIDLVSHPDQLEAMRLLVQLKKIPVISISTEDASRIYYENEDVFNVENPKYSKLFKSNYICKNIQFINSRIELLLSRVWPGLKGGQALNVNFPLMNTQMSRCITMGDQGPKFLQVFTTSEQTSAIGDLYDVPIFTIKNDSVILSRTTMYKVSEEMKSSEEIASLELSRISHLLTSRDTRASNSEVSSHDKNQESFTFYSRRELKALARCAISVTVSDLAKGNLLGNSDFDLMKMF